MTTPSTTPPPTPSPNDDDLRGLLADAVSDVHPEGGTGTIRARARARHSSPSGWLPVTLAAAVATVLVIGGTAWLGRQSDDTPAAGQGAATRTVTVPVYYATGSRLVEERHRVVGTTESDLQLAVDEVISGQPLDPDYTSAWPYGPMTATATSDGQEITIDLVSGATASAAKPADVERAAQALVWTADETTGTDLPVRVTLDGQPATDLFAADVPMPVERASADSVLSTVSISTPAQGATVPGQFEVAGRAATFEANVVWELKQGDQVVQHGFTTAQECCTLSPYSFTVTAPPGDYTLVVHDTDESDGEGVGVTADTKDLTVQ